jgi:HEAT repeat protein
VNSGNGYTSRILAHGIAGKEAIMARLLFSGAFVLLLTPLAALADPEERNLTPFEEKAEVGYAMTLVPLLEYLVMPGLEAYSVGPLDPKNELKSFPDELVRALCGKEPRDRMAALKYLTDRAHEARTCAWMTGRDDSERPFRVFLGKYAEPIKNGLEEVLRGSNQDERVLASSALLAFDSNHAQATDIFMVELRSDDPARREKACNLAGDIRFVQPRIIAAVIENIRYSKNEVSRAAAIAAWHIGPKASQAVPALVELLQAGEPAYAAVISTFPPTIDDAHTRENISLFALAEMGAAAKPALPVIIEKLKNAQETELVDLTRCMVILADHAHDAVPAIVAMLKDAKDDKLCCLLYCLAAIGPKARPALSILRERLAREQRYEQMLVAATILCIDPSVGQATEILITALKRDKATKEPGNTMVCSEALNACGLMCPKAKVLVPFLTASLHDEFALWDRRNPFGRVTNAECAAAALVAMGSLAEPAIPALMEGKFWRFCFFQRAANGKQETLDKAFVSAMLMFAGTWNSHEGYFNSDRRVLSAKLSIRTAKGSPAIIPILIKHLNDSDGNVRVSAAVALGRIRCPEAKDALKRVSEMVKESKVGNIDNEGGYYAAIIAAWALAQIEN